MKIQKITTDKTVLEHVGEGESSYEFVVKGNTFFTLVLLAHDFSRATISVRVRLAGKGANAKIIGIIMGKRMSNIALHTTQHHEAPETVSDLIVKTILWDKAICIYDGGIRVEKVAQKTNAYQRNENLLLSDRAHAQSKPALEILANDVRCTHGATVGPVSSDQVWYMQSRGLSEESAKRLCVEGFLQNAVERIADPFFAKRVWQEVEAAI